MRRRIFIAKAERVDTTQLELEFKDKLAELDRLAGTVGISAGTDEPTDGNGATRPQAQGSTQSPPAQDARGARRAARSGDGSPRRRRARPSVSALSRSRAPSCGQRGGSAPARRRPGKVPQARPRGRRAGDHIDHHRTDAAPRCFRARSPRPRWSRTSQPTNTATGLPRCTVRKIDSRASVCPIDRGSMCRWTEHAGATCGATVVEAMRQDAMKNAFCISTDATGILVPQPLRDTQKRHPPSPADADTTSFRSPIAITSSSSTRPRRPPLSSARCSRASPATCKPTPRASTTFCSRPPPEAPPRRRRGRPRRAHRGRLCIARAQAALGEATVGKSAVAREGLARLSRIFALERKWKHCPPVEKKALRQAHARPRTSKRSSPGAEGRIRARQGSARPPSGPPSGYCVRQKTALMRYLDDGRLEPTNNSSERELRRIAVGRHAWLFVGGL